MSIQLAIFLICCAALLGFIFAAMFRSKDERPPRARTYQDGEGHPVYEIYTIADFFRIPEDRFHIFLRELPYMLSTLKTVNRLGATFLKLPFRWIDDDKGEIMLTVNQGDFIKVKIQDQEPANAG